MAARAVETVRAGAVVCAGARDVLDVLARPSAKKPMDQATLDLSTVPRRKARDSGLGAGRVRAALSMLGLAGLVVEKPGDAFASAGAGAPR